MRASELSLFKRLQKLEATSIPSKQFIVTVEVEGRDPEAYGAETHFLMEDDGTPEGKYIRDVFWREYRELMSAFPRLKDTERTVYLTREDFNRVIEEGRRLIKERNEREGLRHRGIH